MKSLYSIVGMKHRGTVEFVAKLLAGEPLALLRESNNDFDPNAIQVWARNMHVGYVKASQARELAKRIDASGDFAATLSSGLGAAKLAVTADRWPMVEIEE